MKHTTLIITFLSTVLYATGSAWGQTASQGPDNDKSEPKAAIHEVKDYTFAEKTKFIAQMKMDLAAVNRDIDQLDAKIANADAEARAKAKPELHALHVKADHLGKQIEAAKDATESNWDSVKAHSMNTYNELKHGINQAHRWVSDKLGS